ncbi:Permease of the major facilitator superfamily [Phaffia rhodozyma]|uniref:Permease of the major facilitator superfamily n=1 Tax=Phaffia rhodozyma TaxID=264483 RepID=A0A0F7SKP9_PHARH|nr:Permease of the major facilitator superfamily [Phaffia rhodozyma]
MAPLSKKTDSFVRSPSAESQVSNALDNKEKAVVGKANVTTVEIQPHDSTKKPSWIGSLWDTYDLEPEERRLLTKVDASILVFASLGYFLKNLDQTNVNTAFLSGMKEELNMNANQLVTATSVWTAGYVIGQIPIQLILTRVSPRWVIPALELGWGVATLALYSIKNMSALYGLRFLVGLTESGFYPAIHLFLGSWYTPRELAKRTSIFYVSGALGTMFSGFLQTAAYEGLNGVHGLAGWRWLFIIDAIITIPIALLGFVFLPGLPWNTKANFWLTQSDIDLANARLDKIKRRGAQPWSKCRVKKLFSTWHIYLLPPMYMLYNNAIAQTPMGYWLKSFNNTTNPPVPGRTYSVSQINLLPLPGTAIFVVLACFYAWTSDGPLGGRRWPWMLFGSVVNIIVNTVLVSTPLYKNLAARFFWYYLLPAAGSIGALCMNWITEITGQDFEFRAITVATANDMAYLVQAIAPNFIWKTVDFPKARKGHIWSISLSSIILLWIMMVYYLDKRDRRSQLASSSSGSFSEFDNIKEDSSDSDKSLEALDIPAEPLSLHTTRRERLDHSIS